MHNFTQEDLLLFLYSETSTSKSAEIKAALETDWNLKEEFELLQSAHNQLKTIKHSPSSKTINNILNYAEKSVPALAVQA
jgi:hypothetical protein